MEIPNFERLRSRHKGSYGSYARHVHPNPRFYKYYWWVFWAGSPIDGPEFLTEKYWLCTASAMILLAELSAKDESRRVYNTRRFRRDPSNPFDWDKFRAESLALSYDEDPDPISMGDLQGHR